MDPYVTLNCLSDETFFIENFFTIRNPFTGRLSSPVNLYPKQHNLIDEIHSEQIIIDIITERQIGTSTILAAHALWLATFNPFMTIGIMGKNYIHAQEYRNLITLAHENLPAFLGEKITEDNKTCTRFANGSNILYLNSSEIGLRGKLFDCLIMDTFECYTPTNQTELYKYADNHFGGHFKQIALL